MIIGFSCEYIYLYECMIPDRNMGRCFTICVLDSCCIHMHPLLNLFLTECCQRVISWKWLCNNGKKHFFLHFDQPDHAACDCIEILCIWIISCMGLRPSVECASNLMFECSQRVFIWKGPCNRGLKYYCLHFDNLMFECSQRVFIWKGPCNSGLKYYCLHFDNLMFECSQRFFLSGRDLAIVGWNIIVCILINTEHVFWHMLPSDPSMRLFPVLMLRFHIGISFICVIPVISYPGSLCGLRRIQISKSVCASLHELIWLLMGRSIIFFFLFNYKPICGVWIG